MAQPQDGSAHVRCLDDHVGEEGAVVLTSGAQHEGGHGGIIVIRALRAIQASMTSGTIMGRRRRDWFTQRPIVRLTICDRA